MDSSSAILRSRYPLGVRSGLAISPIFSKKRIVFVGTPEQLTRSKPNYKKPSHTGVALRNDSSAMGSVAHPAKRRENGKTKRPQASNGAIRIRNAREHNLKGINIKIPRDRFTVITGVSGSGKSTVAFDIFSKPASTRCVNRPASARVSCALRRTCRGGYLFSYRHILACFAVDGCLGSGSNATSGSPEAWTGP